MNEVDSRLARPYTAAMKILAVGDMHLGRRPSRIPEGFSRQADELSPAVAWRKSCELAIAEQVAAVLLAGDVIESERDFFEGYRELKAGVERLAAENIQVIAVAGNHDVEVLPRLADALADEEGFKLLGRGGVWESIEIGSVRIHGWSFPRREVWQSPLEGANLARDAGFQLALLHCDLDASGSRYAPVMRRELDGAGFDAWLLGHIHAPHALSPKSPKGYLGCVSGMDPGEPGPRGPWLMRFEGGRLLEMEQIPLAPIRWEAIDIDLGNLEDIGDLDQSLIDRARELDRQRFATGPTPLAVGLRPRFTGHSAFCDELPRRIARLMEEQSSFHVGEREYFIEHCETAVLPRIDLHELAARGDPLGLLAARLLLLERPAGDAARAELIAGARAKFHNALAGHRWRDLESNDEALADSTVVERLRLAGFEALRRLHAQQQGEAA